MQNDLPNEETLEKALDNIWFRLIHTYGYLFTSTYGEDWRNTASGAIWEEVLSKHSIEKIRGGFKKLIESGMPEKDERVNLSVYGFLKLCPTDAEVLGLPSFEKLWHDVQLSKYSERNKYVKWILANASKHECDFNLLRENNKTAEKQMRKMYQALVNFSKNGGQLQDEAEKPVIEEKVMEKSEFLAQLQETMRKNGLTA